MAQQPDLQAILATLAQYSQQSTANPAPQPAPYQHVNFENATPETTDNPNSSAFAQNATVDAAPADPRLRNRPQSRSVTPAQPPNHIQAQAPSVIDPATITVWQDGLRCVTKIAAQNKMFETTIRRMMRDQRANEMRWYTERQALKQAQISRSSSAAKALSILQSLNQGGVASAAVDPQSEEAKEAELAVFDRKVYSAQHTMETAMTVELKGLGVPFFGTSSDLIIADGQQVEFADSSGSRPRWSVPVSETELLDLKRKMIAHLEMLYRD